jgi:hypothetical protein
MKSPHHRHLAIVAATVFGLLPAGAAQAQWYSSYPPQAHSYAPPQPYAIEVAPNTYVIRHPLVARDDARVICVKDCGVYPDQRVRRRYAGRPALKKHHLNKRAERKLVDELRKRSEVKRHAERKVEIVRDKPVVVVHRRVVDDPPRVVERSHVVEGAPPSGRGLFSLGRVVEVDPPLPAPEVAPIERRKSAKRIKRSAQVRAAPEQARIIHAEAEVTILGPDRMSIRLYRKPGASDVKADAHIQ